MDYATTTKTDRKTTYELVTARLVEALERGDAPWHRPWHAAGAPKNLVSRKAYRGVNQWLTLLSGYTSPWWVTFKQAQSLGGTVRKGEKGTLVIFYRIFRKEERNDSGDKVERKIPVLKHYWVFNVEQCDGLESKIPTVDGPAGAESVENADAVLTGWTDAPPVTFGGDRAFYSPQFDRITVPKPEDFHGTDEYYQTLYHEMVHATGHENRLGREGIVKFDRFGSEQYSKEELIAEIGACYLTQVAGLTVTVNNSAAYLRGWAKALRADPKLIVTAASAAAKATDYILGVTQTVEGDDTNEAAADAAAA